MDEVDSCLSFEKWQDKIPMPEKDEGLSVALVLIGGRLAEERKRLGWSPDDAAQIGGIGRASHYRYEGGTKAPPTEYLLALAGHGLDMLYVLTGQRGVDTVGRLSAEEAALVDNYRASSPEHQASLRAVGDSFAQQDARKEQARKAGNQ